MVVQNQGETVLKLTISLRETLSRITQAYTSQILRPKSQSFLLLHLRSSFFHSFHQEACIDHTTLQASHSRKVSIFTRMKEGFIIITKQKITVLTEGFELIFGALIRCQCWYLLGCIPPSQELSPSMEFGGSEHLHLAMSQHPEGVGGCPSQGIQFTNPKVSRLQVGKKNVKKTP